MTKTSSVCTAAALLVLLTSCSALKAQTAPTVASDVKPGDWAYSAVQDLASKGLIEGYPPNGDFLGGRAVTRFEMATIIDRVLDKLDDMANSGTSAANLQQQIAEVKQLVSDYHVELLVIGGNITQAQADITKLQGDVATLQQGLTSTQDAVEEQAKRTDALKAKEKADADAAYSSNTKSKFSISGLVQARAVAAASSNPARFPQGSSNSGAYNGDYAQGDAAAGAEVKRARIIMLGNPAPTTFYKLQLDVAGAIGAGNTSTNSQIKVLEAYGAYTPGNGNMQKYPTISAGQFANPYGYIMPASPTLFITPERPLAFSENNNVGMFDSQDYDKGLRVMFNPGNLRVAYALVNGAGRQSENIDGSFDNIVRVGYQSPDHVVNVGTSYYDGHIYRLRPGTTGQGAIPATQLTYPIPKKDLLDFDAQVNLKGGIWAEGEYIRGTYEKRSYFDEDLFTASDLTGGDSLQTDDYVKGNQVQGYYLWGGYTFNLNSPRPLTFAVDYDVFQRSMSAQNSPYNSIANGGVGAGSSSYDDVNIGGGTFYNLDKATRIKLWYESPQEVSHLPGTPEPPHIGLYTMELQTKF